MHNPLQSHLKVVKKILRYLKGTLNLGLHFKPNSRLVLTRFNDVDWASDSDNCISTSGFCIYIWDQTYSPRVPKSIEQSLVPALKPSIAVLPMQQLNLFGFNPCFLKLVCRSYGYLQSCEHSVQCAYVSQSYLTLSDKAH